MDRESTVISNSDYQSIMLFDPATGFDHYNHVPKLKRKEVLGRVTTDPTQIPASSSGRIRKHDPIYNLSTSSDYPRRA